MYLIGAEEEDKERPKLLTWKQIGKQEGVYKLAEEHGGYSHIRFITIHGGDQWVILFYNSETKQLLIPNANVWDKYHFILTDERIDLNLR